jgi:predicted RNase H-like HicB family nuclease
MQKLNLSFFYQAGLEIGRLAKIPIEATLLQVATQGLIAENYVRILIDNPDMPLRACLAHGQSLLDAIAVMHEKMNTYTPTSQDDPIPEAWRKVVTYEDTEFNNVINAAQTFETVLKADLDTLASYYVERKGIYDTDWLIEGAEEALPRSMIQYLDDQAIKDIRSSGRCLALDAPTASGFHILRATESILYRYYFAVCKPDKAERLDSWAAYLSALYKFSGGEEEITAPDVREVYNNLNRIKAYRNDIMHPETELSQDEAFTLFENAKSAIMLMLPHLKEDSTDDEQEKVEKEE